MAARACPGRDLPTPRILNEMNEMARQIVTGHRVLPVHGFQGFRWARIRAAAALPDR